MKKFLFTLLLSIVVAPAWAAELAGTWKAEDGPGWIKISFEGDTGTGTVMRNDNFPDRVGRKILKDLVAGEKPGTWAGQVYAERLEEYRDAKISVDGDTMAITVKIGFMSRSIDWIRVESVPAE